MKTYTRWYLARGTQSPEREDEPFGHDKKWDEKYVPAHVAEELVEALKRLVSICEGEGWEPIDKSYTDKELDAAREALAAAEEA